MELCTCRSDHLKHLSSILFPLSPKFFFRFSLLSFTFYSFFFMKMDLRSSLPSSSNNVFNQMDGGSYQFIQQGVLREPILLPFPPTIDVAASVPMDLPFFMELSHSLVGLVETQRSQWENYIKFKHDWLAMALLQESNQNLISLIRGLESKVSILLRQKDEELTRARDQASALEGCLIRGMQEKETWEKIAKDLEIMVSALKNQLRWVQNPSMSMIEHVGSSTISPHNGRVGPTRTCKLCGSRKSSVLFIPCRHLCACKNCSAYLDACPICHSQKMDSLEVLLE